jgi:hypothetical protein
MITEGIGNEEKTMGTENSPEAKAKEELQNVNLGIKEGVEVVMKETV